MRRDETSTDEEESGNIGGLTGGGAGNTTQEERNKQLFRSDEFLKDNVYRNAPLYRSVAVPIAPQRIHAASDRFAQQQFPSKQEDEIPKITQKMASLKAGFDAPPGIPAVKKPSSQKYPSPSQQSILNVEEPSMLMDDSADKDAEIHYLPECFNYNTSVISMTDKDALLDAIDTVLKGVDDCEHRVRRRNYKISGRYFWEDKMCAFMIHFFKTPEGCKMIPEENSHQPCILLEFQRRQGDAFAFQRIYRRIVSRLRSAPNGSLIHFNGNPFDADPYTLPEELPTLPLLGELTDELALLDPELAAQGSYLDFSRDRALGDNLVRMCRSIYLEPRREATCVLARGSRSEATAQLLSTVPHIMAVLCQLLKDCMDIQVMRNTALVLTNLFKYAADVRGKAIQVRMLSVMGQKLHLWSGCGGDDRHVSKLVSCQIGEAMTLLVSGGDQSVIESHRQAIEQLREVKTGARIPEAQRHADTILQTITGYA